MAGSEYRSAVLAATDIVELIGKTVPIKRRGKNYTGLCPFHNEKSPSFNVDPGKQYFHCFGCKKHGNAIDFVMERDRLEFVEAMRVLGDAAGLPRPNQSSQAKQQAGQRQQLLDACSTAATVFEQLLNDPQRGAAGRAYLAERGFTEETAKRFRLGVAADGWDGLLRHPLMRPFPPAVMALAGLVKSREGGNGFYDTFRNRLMFPIRDENGRVIAFGGRVMPGSTDKAKYLNSPETPLFSKSRTVFGLDLGRQKIVESRTVAVVEGYADVTMAHQYGASNVVSPLGTALTEQHVTILRRFADRIVLLFDGDAAGDTAVDRAVELFLTQPVEVAIASLPDGLDPDEYLLKHGLEPFNGILTGAPDALTFKTNQLAREYNRSELTFTAKQKRLDDFAKLLGNARGSANVNELRWNMGFRYVTRMTGISEAALRASMDRGGKPGPAAKADGGPAGGGAPAGDDRPRRTFRRFNNDGPIEEANFSEWVKASGRRFVPRRGAVDADPYASHRRYLTGRKSAGAASSSAVPAAVDRAERAILAVLLAEPHRWAAVQTAVSPATFTDDLRRRLAVEYWNHQRDEGEPVFNEFLGSLTDPDVAELAIELVQAFDAMGPAEEQVRDAVRLLAEVRDREENGKLLAALSRTSVNAAAAASPAVSTGTGAEDPLRVLQEKARRPDMRRLGS